MFNTPCRTVTVHGCPARDANDVGALLAALNLGGSCWRSKQRPYAVTSKVKDYVA